MQDVIGDLIRRVNAKQPGAQDALFAAAYPELRKLARARLRDGGRRTALDTTELVHESYLRFGRIERLSGETRRAFFAYASSVMRSVIVDAVRARGAERRGGDSEHVTLDTWTAEGVSSGEEELIWLHEALDVLAHDEPRLAKLVEMRYFGGYTEIEIGEALNLTDRTVRRDWNKARLLLSTLLEQ